MIIMFSLKFSHAAPLQLLNAPSTRRPSNRFFGKMVHLLCFASALTLSVLTPSVSAKSFNLTLLFLTSSPSFLLLPLSVITDYCSASDSTCWISNRPLRQKSQNQSHGLPSLGSPSILTSSAAVLTILHSQACQSFEDPFVASRKWTEGLCVGHHSQFNT